MPVGEGLESFGKVFDHSFRNLHTIFKIQRLDFHDALLAMGFGVETANEFSTSQDRQTK